MKRGKRVNDIKYQFNIISTKGLWLATKLEIIKAGLNQTFLIELQFDFGIPLNSHLKFSHKYFKCLIVVVSLVYDDISIYSF